MDANEVAKHVSEKNILGFSKYQYPKNHEVDWYFMEYLGFIDASTGLSHVFFEGGHWCHHRIKEEHPGGDVMLNLP